MTFTDSSATVHGATSATVVLAGATNFVSYADLSRPIRSRRNDSTIDAVRTQDVRLAARRARGRSSGAVPSRPARARSERRRRAADRSARASSRSSVSDPGLAALFFQYGRYLLIASSRAGGQPANLQGLWNDSNTPPWDSKWTVNINTEMNYWLAEPANLAELHEPLFDLIRDVAETGARRPREHYGARGWVLHHNTDLWRGTAPINASNHGIWPTGGAWLCAASLGALPVRRRPRIPARHGVPAA